MPFVIPILPASELVQIRRERQASVEADAMLFIAASLQGAAIDSFADGSQIHVSLRQFRLNSAQVKRICVQLAADGYTVNARGTEALEINWYAAEGNPIRPHDYQTVGDLIQMLNEFCDSWENPVFFGEVTDEPQRFEVRPVERNGNHKAILITK